VVIPGGAGALAATLPSTGPVIASVMAMWDGLSGRIDKQGRRFDTIEAQ
jgi:hypothetical protein